MKLEKFEAPAWAREIQRFLTVKPQFLLCGNVYDYYPTQSDENAVVTTAPLPQTLKNLLVTEGYDLVLRYEPMSGFTKLSGNDEDFETVAGFGLTSDENKKINLEKLSDILEKFIANKKCLSAIILNFGSRFEQAQPSYYESCLYRIYKLAANCTAIAKDEKNTGRKIAKYPLIFWILDKENDLPPWYSIDNPQVHVLNIQKPDYNIRRFVIQSLLPSITGYDTCSPEERKAQETLFLDQTNGMFAREIRSITQIAIREHIEISHIADAIRHYKIGIIENPWTKISNDKIKNAETALSKKVIGQELAVRHSIDVLKRSMFNLSGSQFSQLSQKPKGVLFFAGPTGVGKTELAKSITDLVFGSPTNYIRFDMSEFAQEHASQRLIGAPPGYLGHDCGGQLTNAIKQNPFSLVLFDEIEKGNPKIMDIFLQILDDGRLTSGRGETVYFSEALVVFTSNLGMNDEDRSPLVQPSMPYKEMQAKVRERIIHYFTHELGRPEILNRIGENNIIVFDFIREEIAGQIFEKMLGNVTQKLNEEHKIQLEFDPDVKNKIQKNCCADLKMGGRGIGNMIEKEFVNPLSRALFAIDATAGTYRVTEYVTEGDTSLSVNRVSA